MRKTSHWIVVCCCVLVLAVLAVAQARQKPGLWEMTTKMNWVQSPFPNIPGMPNMAAQMSAPHTVQVCITKEMIDKYGGPMPQSRNNECKAENVKMGANSMTADWVCNGSMKGKGTVESSWTDENHSTSKVHFTGAMQMGPDAKTVEYIMEATSVFKGDNCGSVKPISMDK